MYFRQVKDYKGTELTASQWDRDKKWEAKRRGKCFDIKLFAFRMKRGSYKFGAETASSQNIRDLCLAVAQRKKRSPHSLTAKAAPSAFQVAALITDHLIYLGAVPGSISNFIPIRAMM